MDGQSFSYNPLSTSRAELAQRMTNSPEPKNCQDLCDETPDSLFGDHSPLYQRFRDEQQTSMDLLKFATNAGDEPPMVCLGLVCEDDLSPVVKVLHRIGSYPEGPVKTRYDGSTFALSGDMLENGHVDMVKTPDTAFQRIEVDMRLLDDTDSEVLDWDHTVQHHLEPLLPVEPHETVKVTKLMPVPQPLFGLMFSRTHTPGTLWAEVGAHIKTEGLEAQLTPLIEWMQAAATPPSQRQFTTDRVSGTRVSPLTHRRGR